MEKILVIDDDQSIRETLTTFLKRQGYNPVSAEDGMKGVQALKEEQPELVICDYKMPKMTGLEVLEKIKEINPSIHFIMITAFDEMQTTIEAMKKGAYDFIEKPIDTDRLKLAIKRALDNKNLSDKLDTIIEEKAEDYELKNILIGKSQIMKEIYKKIGQVTGSRVTVLIQGESGTGKELVARSIHYSGITKNTPFIPVNCTALTETLLESELFGHVKGAFTGSVKDKKGKFELAGDGTIFLDEISEISPSLQVKLLRILQEKEFERVGGETIIPMKARIMAASNKNIEKLVEEGKFREDLFYRLKIVTIHLPPLRERKEDIPSLVNHFLNKINRELHKSVVKVPDQVMDMLVKHEWVGNVRELENTLMQAVVLSKGDVLQKEYILLHESDNKSYEFDSVLNYTLHDVEKIHIKKILEKLNWDKPKAAKHLGISLPTLYSKIENYGIGKDK
ncbi:MAG: sigma-54 dependent transcriptional regulator [Melioribacteraceae bacterium]|nr:sigma-54 dependent transcriptional regulator [Melioribacteraceae bacterium]MCF8395599.1 sigma-54 dependent transcriptional regulator [Melioribacteraceae bacterium]MCF8418758.1 sigma-54 dependent transcriptional regulator [Melioribacteraceae bacterium]